MNNIQSLWFNNPTLNEGELIALAYPANHTQNRRAVGGKLFVTNQRLLFIPNKVDDKLGGLPIDVSHDAISTFFVKEREFSIKELFSGGLFERLGVRLSDGSEHLFVISKVEEGLEQIMEVIDR